MHIHVGRMLYNYIDTMYALTGAHARVYIIYIIYRLVCIYMHVRGHMRIHVVVRKGCTYGAAVRVRHCICITIICLLEEYRGVYIYTIQTRRKEEGQDRLGDGRHYWY